MRRRGYCPPPTDETGWFGSKLVKKASKAVSGAAKGVAKGVSSAAKVAGKIPGTSLVTSQVKLASDIARGKNVVASVKRAGSAVAADTRKSLPVAASVVSFVPGVGTGVAAGLSGAAALAQGKSLTEAAKEAAIGAVPGGQLARSAIRAGSDIAQGRNVVRAIGRQGLELAKSQVPGGQFVESAARVVSGAARGQNLARTLVQEGAQVARSQIPGGQLGQSVAAVASSAARGKNVVQAARGEVIRAAQTQLRNVVPMAVRPQFGALQSVSPELIGRVRSAVGSTRPNFRPVVASGRAAKLPFRPLSVVARNAMVRVVPQMIREVSGLNESGTQWIVKAGDTGSGIAQKLTGTAGRWTELKAVNPKIMSRSPDLIKKYGFPIYVGDVINLPASWIKPVVTPASPTTSTPSVTQPPAVTIPGGDLAAQGQARTILAAWGKGDGSSEAGVGDYGGPSEFAATTWSARDKLQAASFANWWRRNGGLPAVSNGEWSDDLAQALNLYAERKANQILNSAASAGGYQIPLPPTTTTTTTTPASTTTPTITPGSAPSGSTPAQTAPTSITLPPVLGGGQIQLPQVVIGGGIAPTTTSTSTTPGAAQATKPAEKAPMSDNTKWGLWTTAASIAAGAAVRIFF